MEDSDSTVRITVVGDPGVGKTSLIAAAATETFPDNPPPVLPPARLPADTTPEGVPVLITDTSSRPEDRSALEQACLQSSVIVLCFAMDRPASLRRISTHWMPELRRLNVTCPVMLVGCKSDERPADQSLHQAVLPIVKTHSQIETCMECSARRLLFVGEVFYYALRAVVHPMAPLYDAESGALRPLCARALRRIFLLCDSDGDGELSDAELNAFQVRCFNAPLQPEELAGVKQVVSERVPRGVSASGGLTLDGFLFLHALFIERSRLETTWAVLRRFGYGDDVRLREDVLGARGPWQHAPDQVAELTRAGRAFFEAAFERADVDSDGVLSAREQEALFATAPSSPWTGLDYARLLVESTRRGGVTRGGFMARWAFMAATAPRAVLEHALYLGWPDAASVGGLVQLSKPRRAEARAEGAQRRALLRGFVFAPQGVDATPVLEGLVAQARPGAAGAGADAPVAAAIAAVGAAEREERAEEGGEEGGETPAPKASRAPPALAEPATLLLDAFTEEQASVLLASPDAGEALAAADVAAFVFDARSPASFRAAAQQLLAVAAAAGDALPCLFLALHEAEAAPELVRELGDVCGDLRLRTPVGVPGAPGDAGVYAALVAAARRGEDAVPDTPSRRAARARRRLLLRAAACAGGGVLLAGGGYLAYCAWQRRDEGGLLAWRRWLPRREA